VGKHLRYSEVKHPDKFAEVLSKLWQKAERYIVPVGIAMVVGLLAVAAWLVASRVFADRSDQPWEERYRLAEEFASSARDDGERVTDPLLAKLGDFVQQHRGRPVAAITLLELAQGHLLRAAALRDDKLAEARQHLQKAAAAAEQFVADFPAHQQIALAHYQAGKARLDLREWERAAEHFEKASTSQVAALAALAKWQAGYCYEQLGRLDQARMKYEELRVDPLAGWCAEQADFALAQLGRRAPQAPQREPAAPVPSSPNPAPSK